ncbi:hypothetical protein [Nostoc sp. CHAB 5715]|uniref:hypothetical protein n=1 Tax=Nostoc sp. CHAB 5715 TaxID=2780400 RepID=UPI001E4818D3|nr:hypothetical protein [Nostoc sp. CHAB 5715]MCC5621427.1 hypothetical protein [Nostoc sp. CHAB 5715]
MLNRVVLGLGGSCLDKQANRTVLPPLGETPVPALPPPCPIPHAQKLNSLEWVEFFINEIFT